MSYVSAVVAIVNCLRSDLNLWISYPKRIIAAMDKNEEQFKTRKKNIYTLIYF